jgi:uncharacterized damage-inducible protein DinB
LRNHLEYTAWASKRLLDAVTGLSPEQLTRDFQTADRSIVGTLAHVYAGDRVWLARVTHAAPGSFISDADRDLSVLVREWPALLDRWRQWAAPFSDQDILAPVSYKDLKGNSYSQPAWQIVLHVVNHGTHHRGQVSGFLRAMGQTPPPLDLMAFYRAQAAATA